MNALDPVDALLVYTDRTADIRASVPCHPVFLTLKPPFRPLVALEILGVLEAMNFAGIDWSKFSPKDFRPTGAATAIEAGIDPSSVQAIGYWKTSDVFFRLAKPPVNYTDTEVLETQC